VSYPTWSGAGGHYHYTQFHYQNWQEQCFTGNTYTVKPVAWDGGAIYGGASYPSTPYCVTQQAGTGFTKNSTTAITWSNGASLASIIGIDLSSRTGYTSSAEITFHFSATHRLCGKGGTPGSTAYLLQALP
jgi:hypothetical protein